MLFAYWPFAYQSTIPKIDEVLMSMTDIDPVHRLDAKEAKDRLETIVYSMAPESLLIKPDNDRHGVPWYPAYYLRELFYINIIRAVLHLVFSGGRWDLGPIYNKIHRFTPSI